MSFFHNQSKTKIQKNISTTKQLVTIHFHPLINCVNNNNSIILTGPLGSVNIFLGLFFHNCTTNSVTLINPTPNLKTIINKFNDGLIIGYSQTIFQSGVWTVLRKPHPNQLLFQLGYSHPTSLQLPNHLVFKSKKDGHFRTIHLFSLSSQLLANTSAQFIRLKPAEPYKLNGFRYANVISKIKIGKNK